MGTGFQLKCEKCGYSVDIYKGIGMLHPLLENEVIDEIKLGKHGNDLKRMVEDNPVFLTDISHEAFLCDKCKQIKSDLKVELHFAELGKVVKVTHHCDICGRIMKETKNTKNLKCPNCQTKLSMGDKFCWD